MFLALAVVAPVPRRTSGRASAYYRAALNAKVGWSPAQTQCWPVGQVDNLPHKLPEFLILVTRRTG